MSKAKYVSMWILGAIILIAILCARAYPDWVLYTIGVIGYLALFPALCYLFKLACKEANNHEDKE